MTYNEFKERLGSCPFYVTIKSVIDLEGNNVSFQSGTILDFQGGGFVNSSNDAATLNLKNTTIKGLYDRIIHSSNVGTIDITNIPVGTYRYDSTSLKPVWWNGTAWVDATGTPV